MLSFSPTVLTVKIIVSILFAGFLIYRLYMSRQERKAGLRRQRVLRYLFLIILACTGIFTFFNLGQLRGQGFIHYGEMYHYYFGSKYYHELGYFDLYNATMIADAEQDNTLAKVNMIQDLENYTPKSRWDVLIRATEIKSKFSDRRWSQFSADLRYFIAKCNTIAKNYFPRFLQDHGYNGTPVFTLFTGLLTNLVPVTNLGLLGFLDILLLILMFIIIARSFGFEMAAASVIFFSVNILNDYGYVMGSILRYDWLVCLVIAGCWLVKKKYLPVGILLAYAVLVRIFPLIFLCGLVIAAVWATLKQKKIPVKYLRLAGGFAGSIVVLFALSLIHPQPIAQWQTFFKNMQLHNTKVSINFVGLKNLLLADSSYFNNEKFKTTYRDSQQGMIANWQAVKLQTFSQRSVFFYSLVLLILAALVLLIRKQNMDDPEALGWGVCLCFTCFMMSHYYFMFLLLWFIMLYKREVNIANTVQLLILTVLQIVFYLLDLKHGGNIVFFTLVSLVLGLYFLGSLAAGFLLPETVKVVDKTASYRRKKRKK